MSAAVSKKQKPSFTSLNPPSIVRDGVTDCSVALQAELDRMEAIGGGTLKLLSRSKGIRINSSVQVGSNTKFDLSECRVVFGANGNLGIQGDLNELPATSKPILFSAITAGATSFSIIVQNENVTPAAGQQFTLRGQQDATGRTINKETAYIASVVNNGSVTGGVKWTITPIDPIQNSYSVRYTGDDYELATGLQDKTNFTINIYSALTANTPAGARSITVADASIFTVGDYVMYADKATVGSETLNTADKNPINTEFNRIVEIVGNVVKLEHLTYNALTTANKGGITKITPALNSEIVGARATYGDADGVKSRHALFMKYAASSKIYDCKVDPSRIGGVNYGCYGNMIRVHLSYDCTVFDCVVRGKPDDATYISGEGYGFVLIGSTHCKILFSDAYNCRHSFLHQAANGNMIGFCKATNDRAAAIDFHGINSKANHVFSCDVYGGPLSTGTESKKRAINIGNTSHIYGDFDNTVEGIKIYNYVIDHSVVDGIALQLSSPSRGNTVRNITVEGSNYGIFIAANTNFPTDILGDNLIEDVLLKGITSTAVDIDGGTNKAVQNLILKGVVSDSNATHFAVQNVTGFTLERGGVKNSIPTSGRYAAAFEGVTGLKVKDCLFDGANRGISILDCPSAQITDNDFANQIETTVFKDDTTTGNNNGYRFEGNRFTGTATPAKSLGSSTGGYVQDASRKPIAIVPINAATTLTWTDMPSAETVLAASSSRIIKFDMTEYDEVRLLGRVSTAGVSGAKLILRYNTANSVSLTVAGNWDNGVGTSEVAMSLTATGMIDSGWIKIANAAKGDYNIAIIGSGGDGAVDPVFGNVYVQFR